MSRPRVLDALIVLLVLSLLATVLRQRRTAEAQFTSDDTVRSVLTRVHDQIIVRAAIEHVEQTRTGYPLDVPTEWFNHELPRNPLVPHEQPWLDIAEPSDTSVNPQDPVIYGPDQAGIWYNPESGILRARVMPQFSDTQTLSLYNRINGTSLTSIPRATITPAGAEASPARILDAEVIIDSTQMDTTVQDVDTQTEPSSNQTAPTLEPHIPPTDGDVVDQAELTKRPTLNDRRE